MAKIDRLGWAAGICLDAYGVKVGVRVNKAEALERLAVHLPPHCQPAQPPFVDHLYSLKIGGAGARPNVRNYTLLYYGLTRISRTMIVEEALDDLESHLQLCVADGAPERVFVHAGVVGWQGKAILIPGRSQSGKSTLVANLLAAGATYYSDEYAVIDSSGLVHPYARRLALRQAQGEPMLRRTAEELGSSAGQQPLPVGLVALTRYQSGARWCPKPVSVGAGLLELLHHTVPARREPERALVALERAVATARMLKGARGEADDAAHALLDYSRRQNDRTGFNSAPFSPYPGTGASHVPQSTHPGLACPRAA
jgi:hypothetical protein